MIFGVLGPVAVWSSDGEPVPVSGLKVRALLAVLLANEGRPVPTLRLVDALWGQDPPGDPAGTLSGKVTQLRRAFERAEPGGRLLVVSPPPGYRVRFGDEDLDAHRFRTLAARARTTADARTRADLLFEALDLWRGPAFADFADEPFARAAAARLNEERLTALEDQAEARLALGEHTEAAAELAELLAEHPLRERLGAAYVRALYLSGRPGEALDAYEHLRRRLANELGLDPGPDLVDLQRAVLARDPVLDVPRVRLRTNLPAAISELIGREQAAAGVRAKVATQRLVTLTGPGGVGKTRLALASAEALVDNVEDFPDGVWLAALDTVEPRSNAPLDDVVMAALDIREVPGATDPLVDALRTRRMLLLLDSCEHVVDRAAALVGRLLRSCPDLRILATSREPLRLAGEVVWTVPPLEEPAAVRLFAVRAAAAAPGFALTPEVTAAVALLCRRLDGIPLALELAATRVRALGIDDLVSRLDGRFRLLTGGHRDAPARQQTLSAMIDWSWNLLTEPEQRLLRRLAVHADGCTLEAAEQVSAAPDRADVASLLSRLVERSLVTVTHTSDGPRYRLLETVATYCDDKLAESGETDRLRGWHGRYYADLAARAEPELYGHDQRRWLRRLDSETANLRSALDNAVRQSDGERALRIVCALTWYWFLRGRLSEAQRSLGAAMAAQGQAPPAVRARAAAWQAGIDIVLGQPPGPGGLAFEQVADPVERARAEWFVAYAGTDHGDVPAVDELLDRALAGFRAAGDQWGIAAALSTRAKVRYLRNDPQALARDGERSAELFRGLGDRWGMLQATGWLGGLAEMVGDYRKATRLHREGLRLAEELGLWPEVSVRLAWLGWVAVQEGDYSHATALNTDALRLAKEQGFKVGEIFAEVGLAFAARRQGHLDLAEQYLTKLLRAAEGVDDGRLPPLHLPLVLTELGYLAERRHQAAEAKRLHLAALRASRAFGGGPRGIAMAFEGLAGATSLSGGHETAAALLGAADSARKAASAPAAPTEQAEIDRIATTVRGALGVAAFEAAYREGATRPSDDVATDLLDEASRLS